MMYTTNGRFIFKEHFTPPNVGSGPKNDHYKYYANGQLKAVSRAS